MPAIRRRIQNVPHPGDTPESVRASLVGLREVVQYITGQSQPVIEPLPKGASTDQIIAKVNEIIARLQGTGA